MPTPISQAPCHMQQSGLPTLKTCGALVESSVVKQQQGIFVSFFSPLSFSLSPPWLPSPIFLPRERLLVPLSIFFPSFAKSPPRTHPQWSRLGDGSTTEMPLSTSRLLVLEAPDGCPQGSLQLSINIKPVISKEGPDDAQVCGSGAILPRVNQ